MDLCLELEGAESDSSRSAVVEEIGDLLKERDFANVTALSKSRVPVVKFRDTETYVKQLVEYFRMILFFLL